VGTTLAYFFPSETLFYLFFVILINGINKLNEKLMIPTYLIYYFCLLVAVIFYINYLVLIYEYSEL